MQTVTVKAEVNLIVEVPEGRPHIAYAEEAVTSAMSDKEIYLDGPEDEPVKVFVDSVDIEIEDVEEGMQW